MKIRRKDGIYKLELVWNIPVNISGRPPDRLEYSKVEITQVITDGADCYPWQEVYAWLPVKTVSGRYVWGEKIFKRRVWVVWGQHFHMEPETQYASLVDLLSYEHTPDTDKV